MAITPNRNRLVSFMQSIGIICVVVGHSFLGHTDFPLRQWVISFEMPLFMALSGFLAAYTLRRKGLTLADMRLWGRGGYLTRKASRLLLPYLILSTLTFPVKAYMSRWAVHPLPFTFGAYVHQLIYPLDNVIAYFWFLPALFLIFCMWSYGAKLLVRTGLDKLNPLWLLVPLAVLDAWNPVETWRLLCIGRALAYMVFFGVGFFGVDLMGKVESSRHVGALLASSAVLSVLLIMIPYFNGRFILTALNGMTMCLTAAVLYKRSGATWLDWMDGSTYAIYLFSWYPQVFCQQLLGGVVGLPWGLCTVLSVVLGVSVPWLLWRYVLRPLGIKL